MIATHEDPERTSNETPVVPAAEGRPASRSGSTPAASSQLPALENENALFLRYLNVLRDRTEGAAPQTTLTLRGERDTASDRASSG